ncbi:MarR family winged helix-turn-helix transcriptional regulator [Serinicoccus kebangsaanensis]|uniref:MarR family winged helix-turn-helix transcriptional regulator n=1 Tax=Serinicoccus kebangsaanensis TaxID=2602069 RepID=UPI00124C66AB|nr:MarR family transcriptional regulator [Serinicoccus kebangsaanensis]
MSDPAPDPATAALAHDLRMACMRVARRVRFDVGNTIAPHHFSVLVRLHEQPRTLGELAAIEQVSPPSMSRSIDQLADLGYVVRSPDPDDGRLVRLSLTGEGRDVVGRERELRDAWMAARIEGLSDADRTVLRRATDLLEGLLEADRGGAQSRASGSGEAR